MADVYVNALTTISTEPTSTDSVVCVNRNTNEGQIIDYNLLADVILSKISSKTFSSLTTTSKLLTGAINELDGDVTSINSSLGTFSMKRFTFSADVGTTVNVESNSRIVIVTMGASSGTKGVYLLTASSVGVLDVADVYASSMTYTTATNSITFTSSLSGHIYAFTLSGGVS